LYWVHGFNFWVQGSGIRVQCFLFRFEALGFNVDVSVFWIQCSRVMVCSVEIRDCISGITDR